jgi:hypothetical protein
LKGEDKMRRAKAPAGRRRPDALSRVRRDALSALRAWQQELEKQLALVKAQMGALSGPAPAAPGPPRRRRKPRKAAAKKAARKVARKPRRKVARKKKARKVARRRAPRKAAAKGRRGARRKVTLAQAIAKLLKDKGRPMRPVEIANLIRDEKRYKSKSKNLYNAVMTNLVRSKNLKKNRAGLYTVA